MIFINPTRTNLRAVRDKRTSVTAGVVILKARRQALIAEFLSIAAPLIRSREEIRRLYGVAIDHLALCHAIEGEGYVRSLAALPERPFGIEMRERNTMGLRYRDVQPRETAVREWSSQGYDALRPTFHTAESIFLFERTVDVVLELAAFESRLKRLGDEIVRVTHRIRILEERIVPDLSGCVRFISQYIGEREREAYYRLKIKKRKLAAGERTLLCF